MRKYLFYEFKKNLLPIVVFTVISCLIYLVSVLNSSFVFLNWETGVKQAIDTLVGIPTAVLCVLCTIVPIMNFAFKTSRRQCDCIYAMPLRREKIYLAKTIIGLAMVFIPYTICYWLGFTATALSENMFKLSGFVQLFFITIPLGVALFGINTFAFTRANKMLDGIIFMAAFTFAIMALVFFIDAKRGSSSDILLYLTTYSPIIMVATEYNEIIRNATNLSGYTQNFNNWISYVFAAATGVASYAGLYFLTKKEKAEKAQQLSCSPWFGYKIFIPFFLVISMGMCDINYNVLVAVIIVVTGVVGYMIYRRSFKLTKADLITLGSSLVLGIILSFI